MGVMLKLKDLGIKIPEEVAIIGLLMSLMMKLFHLRSRPRSA
jgi:DNA-binding LacI/PurR family transcriptional regulator